MRTLLVLVITLFSLIAMAGQSKIERLDGPDCGGPNHWATTMTLVHMKGAGLVATGDFDFTKTKTVRIASQKTGKDLWRQVYWVTFTKKSGEVVETIAVHDASMEECSMSGVDVFVVSKHITPTAESAQGK